MFNSHGHAGIAADSHPACISRPAERQWRWFLPALPPGVLTGLVALLGILLLAAGARTQDLASDRAALVVLYNATDGPNWFKKRNWLSDHPLDMWNGVTVHNGRVTGLFLHFNQLTGPLPSELGDLTNLQELDLGSNELTGLLPSELGNLANLQQLDLGSNELTGPLPPELGELAELQELDLFHNQLTGSLPPELGKLVNLQKLDLASNHLTGPLPPELGELAELQELDLFHNQLTGSLPPELGKLASLERLHLIGNELTGPLPSELGNLANLRELILGFNRLIGLIPPELSRLGNLQRLYLVENQLTGSIPPELGNLANLQELSLEQNQLTGSIPPELGNLANLQDLGLSNNELTGPIPPELGNLANVKYLDLVSNQLTGLIPHELGNPANLERLALFNNQLTGPIPSGLGNLANLQDLLLSNNELTGSIPSELGNLINLERLWLGMNQLTGPIQRELGNLVNLKYLALSENQLTGPIPSELGKLANLERLFLFNNQLTGPIPSGLGDLVDFLQLVLSENQLTGPIPSELGKLANLERLSLRENQLMGPIPPELGNLANLETLDLVENRLTGPIPSELGNLANLARLNLDVNQLTGPIPSELGRLSNLESLSLGFNQLTGPIPVSFANLAALERLWFLMNPGLCAGADTVIREWLDGVTIVVGPDCSPSITLSVTPSNLVEGRAATVTVTATQSAVSSRTSVNLLFGGTATTPGERQDYRLSGHPGSFNAIINFLNIPANRTSGTRVLTFFPLADGLIEGQEDIILQAFVGGMLPDLRGARVEGSAFLSLSDQIGCVPRDRAALLALYHATGGGGWTNRTNWLSARPLSEWYGVTVDDTGCVTHLDLSNNQLTGPLPSELGNLVHLEGLDLRGNRLTGMFPPSFTNLVALKKFWFHLNSGLCAQADTSTRTWLNGIGGIRGPDCSSVFVPALLIAAGRNNSFFNSELTLTNRGVEEAVLHYTYSAHAGGGSGTATDRLAAGSQRIVSDALVYLRGLGIPIPETENRIGTLGVEVSGSSEVSVLTRTTTAVPEGRAGLAYPGIAENEGLQEAVYLCGLRQNTQDRSNVALQNMGDPGDGPIILRTTLFSGEADDTSSPILQEVTLNPGGFHQYSGLLGMLGTPAHGYVKVEKIEGDAPFYAYGVINDNFNSDGSFVFPVTESSLVGTRGQTLPVIIESGSFQSELTVTNFSASEKTVTFSFVAESVGTGDDTAEFSLTLEAGQQTILPNLVSWMRQEEVAGLGPAGRAFVGALFATVAEGDMSGIVTGARTGSPDQRGGQYSLFYNGVPYGSASVESAWIYGLQQNEENRSNLALVNTGEVDDSSITLEITIYDGSGDSQPRTRSIVLGPRRWHQFNGILGQTSQGYVQVRKVSGNNPFVPYGVINDGGRRGERSGDGAYLPARE